MYSTWKLGIFDEPKLPVEQSDINTHRIDNVMNLNYAFRPALSLKFYHA